MVSQTFTCHLIPVSTSDSCCLEESQNHTVSSVLDLILTTHLCRSKEYTAARNQRHAAAFLLAHAVKDEDFLKKVQSDLGLKLVLHATLE